MATKIRLTFEKTEGEDTVDIVLAYTIESPSGPLQGVFRQHFTEEGLKLLRQDFDSLPGQKVVEWASPKASLPFPPTMKLFIKKALGLF